MIPTDTFHQNGIVWHLSAIGRDVLTPEILDLTASVSAGRAQAVKAGAHRAVYHVQSGAVDLFWKHAKFNGPRAWGRDVLRGPKAGIEFRRLEELRAKGIPTIVPLAWGRVAGLWPRGSHLVTLAVPNAVTLGEYLTTCPHAVTQRRMIAVKLAGLLAELHAAGFVHADLHPGNILLDAANPHDDWRLIDVHDLESFGGSLPTAARVRNLVSLNRWFNMRAAPRDRAAFWRAYRELAGLANAVGAEIERKTLGSNRDLWRSRDLRCVTDNKDFRHHDFDGLRGHVRKDAPAEAVAAMNDPEALFRHPSTTVFKDSKTSTVAVVQIADMAYVLKRFNIKRWHTPLANLVRPSPALRSWVGACAMENRRLPTPRALAVSHRRRFGLQREGYLLMEHLPAAKTLDEITVAPRKAVFAESADLVRLMHQRGLSHRDLKASNVVVSGGRIFLIDLVGLERQRTVSADRRRRDLTRLCVSSLTMSGVTQTTRLRWLRLYLGGTSKEWGEWKSWWKDILRRCLDKLEKIRLGGRGLH